MKFLENIQAICLVIPKRKEYFCDYIKPTFKNRLGIDVKSFWCHDQKEMHTYDGAFCDYLHFDDNVLPPLYPISTTYATWRNRPNAFNAFKAHKKMLEIAKMNRWEKVLFLEDDIELSDDFEEVFKEVNRYTNILSSHYHMLYFGSYNAQSGTNQPIENNLIRLRSGCGGWHGVVIDHQLYNKLISFEPYGPYDYLCQKYIHSNPNKYCYSVTPSVITQRSGFSYVEGCNLEKPSRYE